MRVDARKVHSCLERAQTARNAHSCPERAQTGQNAQRLPGRQTCPEGAQMPGRLTNHSQAVHSNGSIPHAQCHGWQVPLGAKVRADESAAKDPKKHSEGQRF